MTGVGCAPARKTRSRQASCSSGGQAVGPELERLLGGDAPDDRVHHAGPCSPRRRARVLEEGDVAAGAPLLVGIEEVVDGRIVLVDRLLDEPEPEDARVEVDVPRGVAGDRRDVVNAFESHARSNSYPMSAIPIVLV